MNRKRRESSSSDEDGGNRNGQDEISKISSAFNKSLKRTINKMNQKKNYEKFGDTTGSSSGSRESQDQPPLAYTSSPAYNPQRKKSILHNVTDQSIIQSIRKKSVR